MPKKEGFPAITERFLERLSFAFDTITQPDGTPYIPEDVMVETNRAISASYLRRLRAGHISNPSIQIVEALANFFRVQPSYFLDDPDFTPSSFSDEPKEELLHLLEELRPNEIRALIKQVEIIKDLRL